MKPSASKRQIAERKGRKAETLVIWWLRIQGYKIIGQREKTPKGEIDIIAQRGNVIAFIEVKARADFTRGIQAISHYQVKRIIAAAKYWLSTRKNLQNFTCRFDIVLVKPYLLVKHIKNAFDESARGL